ncbi:MAG: DUF6077 domain-containing protein [Polyangiales bacterium]
MRGIASSSGAASGEVPSSAASIVVLDLACVLFAAWTVACNAVVFLGGKSAQLAAAGVSLALGLAGALVYAGRRNHLGRLRELWRDPSAASIEREHAPWPLARITAAFAAVVLTAHFASHRDLKALSVFGLVFFVASFATIGRSGRGGAAPAARVWHEALLWSAALACAVLTLLAHRPDSDDSFYVNMAVSVVDFPNRALLSTDTLHGLGAPFGLAAYRAPSIELLAGTFSYLTGVPALYVAHLLFAPVAGLLTPLALARLLRLLDPQRWVFAVLVVLLYLVYDSGVHASLGNFSFVRLFQGKAMFVTMVAPAIMAHGVRFGLAPSRRTFAMLAATQIAALGTTVTAFWAAPVMAVLAVACASAPRWSAVKVLLLAVLSSAYVLGLGVFLKLSQGGTEAVEALVAPTVATTASSNDRLQHAYTQVIGDGPALLAAIGVTLLTWPLCRTSLARRFAVVFPLGFFALPGNPWLADRVASVTTPNIYWRVLWLLPIPLLFGLAATALLRPESRGRQLVRLPLLALLLALFFDHVSPGPIFADGSLRWPPQPKVDMDAYHVARALIASMPPHRQVLAPLPISRVLPMLHGYGHPLFVKASYLQTEPADRVWREQLTQAVSRRHLRGVDPAWMLRGLAHYEVEGVVVPKDRDDPQAIGNALASAQFKLAREDLGYEIWTRNLNR